MLQNGGGNFTSLQGLQLFVFRILEINKLFLSELMTFMINQ